MKICIGITEVNATLPTVGRGGGAIKNDDRAESIRKEEVQIVLNGLKLGRTPGPDGLGRRS